MPDEDKLIYRVELDFGDAQQKFESINAAGERLEQTVDGIRQKVTGSSTATNFLDEAATSATVALERMEELKTRGESGHLDEYAKMMNVTEFRNAESSLSAIVQDMQRIEKLSQTINQRASDYTKKRIASIMPGMQKMAQEGAELYIGSGAMPTDQQIVSAVKARMNNNDVRKTLFGRDKVDEAVYNAIVEQAVISGVSQTQRGSFMKRIIKDTSQSPHMWSSFHDMLPRAFQEINNQLKDPKYVSEIDKREQSTYDTFLTPNERKQLTNLILRNAQFAAAAEQTGIARRNHGKMEVLSGVTRAMVDQTGSHLFDELVGAAKGMGMYGIEDVNDPKFWDRIEPKNNVRLRGSLQAARYLNDTYNWMQARRFNQTQWKRFQPSTKSEFISEGDIDFAPLIDQYEVARYTIDDIKNNRNWNNNKKYTDFRDYHHFSIDRSAHLDRIMQHSPQGVRGNNSYLDDVIYVEVDPRLGDPTLDEKERATILKGYERLFSKKTKLSDGTVINGVISGKGKNADNEDYVMTRINPKSGIEFVRKSRYEAVRKDDPSYWSYGYDPLRDYAYQDFAGGLEYRNKNATPGQSIQKLYGSSLPKNIILVDLEDTTKVASGEKQEKGATGIGAGLNGASIISNRFLPVGAQARLPGVKTALMTANMEGMLEPYGGKIMLTALTGSKKEEGKLVELNPDVDLMINKADLKGAGVKWEGRTYDEILTDFKDYLQKGEITVKQRYADANKRSRWMSPQMAQILAMDNRGTDMFTDAFMHEYWLAGDYNGAMQTVFADDDVTRQRLVKQPGLFNSKEIQNRIKEYRKALLHHVSIGGLVMPEELEFQQAMAAPWIIDAFNANLRNTKQWDKLSKDKQTLLTALEMGDNRVLFNESTSKMLGIARYPATAQSIQSAVNAIDDKKLTEFFTKAGFDPHGVYVSTTSPLMELLQGADFDGDVLNIIRMMSDEKSAPIDIMRAIVEKTMKINAERFKDNPEEMKKRNDLLNKKLGKAEKYNFNNPKHLVEWLNAYALQSSAMGAPNATLRNAFQMDINDDIIRGMSDAEEQYKINSVEGKKAEHRDLSSEQRKILQYKPFSELYHIIDKNRDENGRLNMEEIQKKDLFNVNLPSRFMSGNMRSQMVSRFRLKQKGVDINAGYPWAEIFSSRYPDLDKDTAKGRMQSALRDVYMGFLNADYFALSDYTAAQLLVLKDEALEEEQKKIVEELENGAKIVNGKGKELTVKDTPGIAAEARRRLAKEGVNVIENIGDYALVESAIYENEPVQKLYGQMAQMGFKGLIGKVNLDPYLNKTPSQSPYSPSAQQLEKIKSRDSTLQGLSNLSEKELAEKINNLHLSPTQISEIIRDPRAWAAKRLGGVKDDFTGNYGTAIGDAGHVAIESFLMARMNYGREHNGALMPQEELEKAAAAALQVYDEQVGKNMLALPQGQAELDAMINGTGASHRKHLRVRDYIQNRLLTLYPEDKFAIEAVENKLNGNNPENKGTPLKFNLGNKINSDDPVESLGYFDALVRNRESNQYRIVDLKNQANVKGSDLAKWMMQVYMYGEALPDFIKETGLPELGLEGIDIFKVEENQTQHLDANPEKIKEYGNKVRQAIALIQQLPEAGITDESLNALSYSLKQLFPDVNTDQASSQFAQMIQQEKNISQQLSGTDGKAFGGALLLHDQFNQALDRVNGVNQFLRKADPNRDGVYNSWLLNDRQLSGAKDLIPQLQKEGHYVEAATLEAEINNARSQFDAILPEASVKNLEDATQKLHDFNQDMQTSKGANSRIDFYRQISEQAQHAADANAVLEGRIKQVSAELSKNQLKLKNETDPTRKANLESEIDKQTESIDAMRRTVKANKIRDRSLRTEKNIFDTKFREETWNELNEGYARLQAIRSGKAYSKEASVEEDVDAYRKEVLQQIADAQQYAKKQFSVKRGQGLPDDKVGIIDSESKEYKDYINSLQLMLRGGDIQAVRGRLINDSLRGFSLDQANVLKNVEHAALDDEYVDELNIEEAVRQKQKEIESKKINLKKRLKNTKLNSKQQQMYQRIIDNYDKFDSDKYAEQLKTENENRREINRIHDMQQVAREMNIFGDNTDYMKSSNRAAALMQFEALQKRVSKISDDDLPDYMKRFKQITRDDFLKAYNRNEKERYDHMVAQQRIQDQQHLMQAERAEMQGQQMQRNWNMRGFSDPFSRRYMQRMSMYDQYRSQYSYNKLMAAQAAQAQRERKQALDRLSLNATDEERANAQTSYDTATAALNHWNAALEASKQGMQHFGDESGNFNSAMNAMGAAIDTAAEALDRLIQSFGRQIFQKAISEAKTFTTQFDTQMRQIQAITMKSDSEMATVRRQTIDRAIQLKTPVANVASVEADLYRQGLNDQQVEERTSAIIKFATVAGAKVTDAGKAITTAIQNGLVSSATEAMDVLVALGDTAATTAEQIFRGMQKSAAAAKVAGVSYEELTTLLTIGTSKTQLSGQVIGTGLQTIFSRMNRVTNQGLVNDQSGATTTINDVEAALKSAGVKLRNDDGKSFRNSFDVLRDLSKVWGNLTDIQRSNITYTMAGGRQMNVFQSLMEGMSEDGGAELERLLGMAENSEGTTENKYAISIKSVTAALDELKSTYDSLVNTIAVGNSIAPAIEGVTGIINGFNNLVSNGQSWVAGLAIIGAALVAFGVKAMVANAAVEGFGKGTLGVLGTILSLGAAAGIIAIAGGVGDMVESASNNTEEARTKKQIESGNKFYEAQVKRTSSIQKQIDEVKQYGEAWEKAGSKMNTTEADALKASISQLESTVSQLGIAFNYSGEAILNWNGIVKKAQAGIDSINMSAAKSADIAKFKQFRTDLETLYQENEENAAFYQAPNISSKDFIRIAAETDSSSYYSEGVPNNVYVLFGARGFNEEESLDSEYNRDVISDLNLDNEVEDFRLEKPTDVYDYIASNILQQMVWSTLTSGEESAFEKKVAAGAYGNEYQQIQNAFKEYYKSSEYAKLGENPDQLAIYRGFQGYLSNNQPELLQGFETLFNSSAEDKVANYLKNSSRLGYFFRDYDQNVVDGFIQQAVEDINPSQYDSAESLAAATDAYIESSILRLSNKDPEFLNSTFNPNDPKYNSQITYVGKDGKTYTFGTTQYVDEKDTAAVQQLIDEHYDEMTRVDIDPIVASVDGVRGTIVDVGGSIVEALTNAKVKKEDFEAILNRGKEEVTETTTETQPADQAASKPERSAFVAPPRSITIADNGASDIGPGYRRSGAPEDLLTPQERIIDLYQRGLAAGFTPAELSEMGLNEALFTSGWDINTLESQIIRPIEKKIEEKNKNSTSKDANNAVPKSASTEIDAVSEATPGTKAIDTPEVASTETDTATKTIPRKHFDKLSQLQQIAEKKDDDKTPLKNLSSLYDRAIANGFTSEELKEMGFDDWFNADWDHVDAKTFEDLVIAPMEAKIEQYGPTKSVLQKALPYLSLDEMFEAGAIDKSIYDKAKKHGWTYGQVYQRGLLKDVVLSSEVLDNVTSRISKKEGALLGTKTNTEDENVVVEIPTTDEKRKEITRAEFPEVVQLEPAEQDELRKMRRERDEQNARIAAKKSSQSSNEPEATESNESETSAESESTKSNESETSAKNKATGVKTKTPRNIKQIAEDAQASAKQADLTPKYSSLLSYANNADDYATLVSNIEAGDASEYFAQLFSSDEELRKIAIDLGKSGGKYTMEDFREQLRKGAAGNIIANLIPQATGAAYSYNQQAAALTAIKNGTATTEQMDMIAKNWGIDRNTLMNNQQTYIALEENRQKREAGAMERSAASIFNDLFNVENNQKAQSILASSNNLTENDSKYIPDLDANSYRFKMFWDTYAGDNEEYKSMMKAYEEAGYTFEMDDQGHVTAKYKGKAVEENPLNPFEWNRRHVSKAQTLADVNTIINGGELTGKNLEERKTLLKGYSSEVAQYLEMDDKLRESAEGQDLLKKIKIQIEVDGLDNLVAVGELTQEAATAAKNLSAGGILRFDAMKSIRSQTYSNQQLGGLASASPTSFTREMDQALMSQLGLTEAQYYSKDRGYWQTELQGYLGSDAFETSIVNAYEEERKKAKNPEDRRRIKEYYETAYGLHQDGGHNFVIDRNWYNNQEYQSTNLFEATQPIHTKSEIRNVAQDIFERRLNANEANTKYSDYAEELKSSYPELYEYMNSTNTARKAELETQIKLKFAVDGLADVKEFKTELESIKALAEELSASGTGEQRINALNTGFEDLQYRAYAYQQLDKLRKGEIGYQDVGDEVWKYAAGVVGAKNVETYEDAQRWTDINGQSIVDLMFGNSAGYRKEREAALTALLQNGQITDAGIRALGGTVSWDQLDSDGNIELTAGKKPKATVTLGENWYEGVSYTPKRKYTTAGVYSRAENMDMLRTIREQGMDLDAAQKEYKDQISQSSSLIKALQLETKRKNGDAIDEKELAELWTQAEKDFSSSPLAGQKAQLTTGELMDQLTNIAAAGKAGQAVFEGLDSTVQQQLMNLNGFSQFMLTLGENTEAATQAQKTLARTVLSETVKALEEEGKVIKGLSSDLDTIIYGNVVDSTKQINQTNADLVQMANIGEIYKRLTSGGITREQDWKDFASFFNIREEDLVKYRTGEKSLTADYGSRVTGTETLRADTAMQAAEQIIRASLKDEQLYKTEEIEDVPTGFVDRLIYNLFTAAGGSKRMKTVKTEKSIDEIAAELEGEQLAYVNSQLEPFGLMIQNGKPVSIDGSMADKPLTIAQRYAYEKTIRGSTREQMDKTADYDQMLRLFSETAGLEENIGDIDDNYLFGRFVRRVSEAEAEGSLSSDAAEKLVESEEFKTLVDKGDYRGLGTLLNNLRYGESNVTAYTIGNDEVQAQVRALLEGDMDQLALLESNADLKNYVGTISGFNDILAKRQRNISIDQSELDALRNTNMYLQAQEAESSGTVKKGTANELLNLLNAAPLEAISMIGQYGTAMTDTANARRALSYLQDNGGTGANQWSLLTKLGIITESEVDYYKENLDELDELQRRIDEKDKTMDPINTLIQSLMKEYNVSSFSDLEGIASESHQILIQALKHIVTVSGGEIGEDGTINGGSSTGYNDLMTELGDASQDRVANATYLNQIGYTAYSQYKAEGTVGERANAITSFIEGLMNDGLIDRDWLNKNSGIGNILGNWQNGLYSGNEEAFMLDLAQQTGYGSFIRDRQIERFMPDMQRYFGEDFMNGNFNIDQEGFMSFYNAPENSGFKAFWDSLSDGKAVMESLGEESERANLTLRDFASHMRGDYIRASQAYGESTEDVAKNVSELAKGGKAANAVLKNMATQVTSVSKNQFYRQKYRSGDRSSEVVSAIAGMTGLSEDLVKKGGSLVDQMLNGNEQDELAAVQTWGDTMTEMLTNEWQSISTDLGSLNLTMDQIQVLQTGGSVSVDFSDIKDQLDGQVSAQLESMMAMLSQMGFSYHLQATGTGESGKVELIIDSLGKGGKGGGGGGGGGGGKSAAQKLMEQLKREQTLRNHEIKMIQFQETRYHNRGEYGNENAMIALENEAQKRLIKTLQDAIEKTKQQMAQTKKGSDDWNSLYDSVLNYEEAIEQATQAIEDNTKKMLENEKAILKTRTDLEQSVLKEIEARKQRERDMLDGTVSMQDIVLEAIRQRYRDEWELVKKDIEKKKEALEEEKSLIDERLQRRKDAEDEAEKYEELSEYKKQLALISMDSTRTKDAAKLREKIAELEKEIAWDAAQDEADYQKEQIDDQLEAYDDFLNYGEEDLESFLEDANNLSSEVTSVLQMNQDGLMQWLRENVKEYALAMAAAQQQMIQGWTDTYEQMLGITHTYWEEINEILTGKQTWLEYMKQSQEYIDASEDERKTMLIEWGEMYDNYVAAHLTGATYSHTDEELAGTGTGGSGGGSGGGGGGSGDGAYRVQYKGYTWSSKYASYDAAEAAIQAAMKKTGASRSDYRILSPEPVGKYAGEAAQETEPKMEPGAIIETSKPLTGLQIYNPDQEQAMLEALLDQAMLEQYFKAQNNKATYSHYASGGLVDYTGPAWVDGTPSKPEAFLSAEDTQMMRNWIESAKYVQYRSTVSNIDGSAFNGSSQNIGELIINITEAQFKDDADFDEVARRVGNQFVKELSKQGFHTMSYSF